jgi:anti-sigma B factor antagonist
MGIRVFKNEADIFVIELSGNLDLYRSNQLKDTVMKLIEQNLNGIIIDMKSVESIASAGVGALITISSTLKKLNYALAIANIKGAVHTALEVSRFASYLPIVPTLKEAVDSIREQHPAYDG